MVNKESPQHRRSLPAQPGLRDRGGNSRGSHSMGAYDREVGPHLLQLFGCSTRSRSTRVVVMTTPPLPAGLYGAWSSARSRPGRRPGPHFPLPLGPRLRLGLRQTVAVRNRGSLRRQPSPEEMREGRHGQAESSEQTWGQRLPGGRGPLGTPAEPGTSGRPQTWLRGQPQAPAVGCPEFKCVCRVLCLHALLGPLFCEVSREQGPGGLEALETTLCTFTPARF